MYLISAPAQAGLAHVAAAGAVARLGHGDQVLQHLHLGLALLRIADQHLDQLLEGEEPVGQLHVALADDLGPFAEGGRVLVVRIEQHHVGGRVLLQDGAQDQRGGAGLAGTGGANDGEMLAEQIIDADVGRDCRILPDATDAHGVAAVAAEGLLQLLARGNAHPVAQRGYTETPRLKEAARAVGRLPQLADQAELGDPQLALALALGRYRHAQCRDDGQHHGIGGLDREQCAHLGPLARPARLSRPPCRCRAARWPWRR